MGMNVRVRVSTDGADGNCLVKARLGSIKLM